MPLKIFNLRIAFILTGVVGAAIACAMPLYFDRFNKLYRVPPGSELAQAQCLTCHEGRPPSLNPFGARLQLLINRSAEGTPSGGVTQDDLIYVEKEDADGDGYTNLEEIVSGTLPGDPQSHPSKHPTNLPEHKISRKLDPLNFEIVGGLLGLGVLMSVGGKAAKKTYMSKIGLYSGVLGVAAIVYTLAAYLLSNRHP